MILNPLESSPKGKKIIVVAAFPQEAAENSVAQANSCVTRELGSTGFSKYAAPKFNDCCVIGKLVFHNLLPYVHPCCNKVFKDVHGNPSGTNENETCVDCDCITPNAFL